MKLLVIYHNGLSDEARSFYNEYVKQGIDLTVIAPSKIFVDKTDSISGFYQCDSARSEDICRFVSVDLRKPNSYGEGFKFFQLLQAIKKIKPDIIHVFDEYSSFYLAQVILCRNILFGRKVPVVAYAFQNIQFKSPQFVFKFPIRFFKRIVRKILHPFLFAFNRRYINGITGCNISALENIKILGAKMPMRLIFWGVDFDIFCPKNRNLCKEKFKIPKKVKLIGYFGRIIRPKGLNNLIAAVSKAEDCNLMLVGNGCKGDNYENELNNLIDNLEIKDRVYRFDSVPQKDLADYYNCLDAFVLPSQTINDWKEQYGRVLVEAMACHIPVIGSSSGAIPEVLRGYPKGLIFREDSINDLVDKINKIDDLEFSENFNIDKFLYKFSVENFVSEHIKFYKKLLR